MNSTTALVPYAFEGHSIRVSTDQQGEAWFVAADVCTALAQHPIARALATLKEEEHCLHSEEGPGSEGLTLALINEAGLLRLLLMGESPTARRMQHWLIHELLPAIQRSHQHSAPKRASTIEAIRKQIAAEVLSEAEEIIHLTGVSHRTPRPCSAPWRASRPTVPQRLIQCCRRPVAYLAMSTPARVSSWASPRDHIRCACQKSAQAWPG